jgi:hypothetical protein
MNFGSRRVNRVGQTAHSVTLPAAWVHEHLGLDRDVFLGCEGPIVIIGPKAEEAAVLGLLNRLRRARK